MDEPPQADLDRKGKRMLGMTHGPLARARRITRAKEGYNLMETVREDEEENNEESQKKPKTAAELTERLKELTVKVENGIESTKNKRAILRVKLTEGKLTEDTPMNTEMTETPEENVTNNVDSNSEDSRASSEDSENDEKELIKAQRQFTSRAVNG